MRILLALSFVLMSTVAMAGNYDNPPPGQEKNYMAMKKMWAEKGYDENGNPPAVAQPEQQQEAQPEPQQEAQQPEQQQEAQQPEERQAPDQRTEQPVDRYDNDDHWRGGRNGGSLYLSFGKFHLQLGY
jgi:type IV secretory pathway VirB10-like protein